MDCRHAKPPECLKENADELECHLAMYGTHEAAASYDFNGVLVDSPYAMMMCKRYLKNLRKADVRYRQADPNVLLP